MNKARRERSPLYPKILFGFTSHPITVWAGVILLRLYFEWMGLRKELGKVLAAFAKRSNHQIPSVDVMLSWFYGLALGAERFEHFTRYGRDRLLGGAFGGGAVLFAGHFEAIVFKIQLSRGNRGERAVDGV